MFCHCSLVFGHMHAVAVVVVEGVQPIDLAIPAQIFSARTDTPYAATLCGVTDRVMTAGGFAVELTGDLDAVLAADTVVVPGYGPYDRDLDPTIVGVLTQAHQRGRRMVSICTGAFALGAAGVLDGRRCTTHWHHTEDLAHRHPLTTVEPGVLYVEDGTVLTSAGMCCGIDLCLHIIRSDLGAVIANIVARDLVAAPHRDGGQAQYIQAPAGLPNDTSLAATRRWAMNRLHEPVGVPALARHAQRSERSFTRRFIAETGTTPGSWLITARLQRARELLETEDISVDEVAHRCGLGTAANLRLHFRRTLNTTPTAYRRTFTHRESTPTPIKS